MDEADRAQRLEEAERAAAIAMRPRVRGRGRRYCVECGEEIPPGRRAAMPDALRCTGCEGERERSW